MRVLLVLIFVSSFLLNATMAQVVGGVNAKLQKAYNSGDYESCLGKAESVILNEKTKKDPEAYLYIAMCFYNLSNSDDPDLQEDYKNGFKEAIKYISKFAKYDKEGEMYADNIEFIDEIKELQFKTVKAYFNEANYRKSASEAKQYAKLNHKKDYSILLFTGMNEVLSNNYSQGIRNIDLAKKEIETQLSSGELAIDKRFKPLLSKAFVSYSDYLVANAETKNAIEILNFGQKMFPTDSSLKTQQNKIQEGIKEASQAQDTIQSK